MGCDVCYTNHAEADGYQSTSFHDARYLRETLGLRPAPEFEAWLQAMGVRDEHSRLLPPKERALQLAAAVIPGRQNLSGSVTHSEVIMRALFGLLALLGVAGIGFGVLTIIRGTSAGVAFEYENYGGPGAIIGGLVLAAVSLYLLFTWGRIESSSGGVHRD